MSIRSRGQHKRRLGRPFTRLWTGFTLASSGDGLAYGAVPLLAVVVDPHPLAVSSVTAADTVPWLLMALLAGHLADRFERGPVIVVANAARACAILLGAFLIATGHITLATLLLVVLVNGAARTVYYTSYQAMVPDTVRHGDLARANSAISGTESTAERLAGPIAGSSLFALGESIPFFLDAFLLVASAVPFLRFRPRPTASAGGEQEPEDSGSRWQGIRLLFGDRRLRVLVLFIASMAFLQGMEMGVLVLLATTKWGVTARAYGLFLATAAVGDIIGSVIAEGQVRRFGSARTMIGFAALSGAGYLVMASAHSWVVAAPAYLFVGMAVITIMVVVMSLRQRFTPRHMLGRVGGAWGTIVWGATPLGSIAGGVVATLWGLRVPLVIAGTFQIGVACILARPLLRIITDDRAQRNAVERTRHANQTR